MQNFNKIETSTTDLCQNNFATLLQRCSLHIIEHENLLTQSGEGYNLLEMLSDGKKELMHSSIIASLLNPQGSHRQGSIFMQKFLNHIPEITFDPSTAKVICEKPISQRVIKGMDSEGGRIDIYIEDKLGHKILIENKWDAEDQECQLIRYHNFDKYALLLYLTRNGKEPTTFSCGTLENGKDFHCISYSIQIIDWLDDCLQGTNNQPYLNASIKTYKNFIEKLNMLNINKDCLSEIVKSPQTIDAAFEIAKTLPLLKINAQEFFWTNLFTKMDKKQYRPAYGCHKGIAKYKEIRTAIKEYVNSDGSRKQYRYFGIRVKIGEFDGHDVYFAVFIDKNIYFPLFSDDKVYNKSLSKYFTSEEGWNPLDDNYDFTNIAWSYPTEKYNFSSFTHPLVRQLALNDSTLVDKVFNDFKDKLNTIVQILSEKTNRKIYSDFINTPPI